MGDVNVNGWVCVVCDIVKRAWESIETLPPQVFNQMPTVHEQVHPESDLHSAGAPQKCPPTILYLLLQTLFSTVELFVCLFFHLNHGNSDPSVETATGINSISDEEFLFWPMAHRQSRLWANHHLQLEQFLSRFNDLTKKIIMDTDCQKGEKFSEMCPTILFYPFTQLFPMDYFHPQGGDHVGAWNAQLHAILARYTLDNKVDVADKPF